MGAPLVLLDRDGVINEDRADHVRSVAQWRAIPGAPSAIARLVRAGFRVMICTNQSGIARGYLDAAELERIHARLRAMVAEAGGEIAAILVCPHDDVDRCDCRKPRPGLLLRAARLAGVDVTDVPFIGDSERDIQAALAVGARAILVETGKGRRTRDTLAYPAEIHADLAAAATALIAEREGDDR